VVKPCLVACLFAATLLVSLKIPALAMAGTVRTMWKRPLAGGVKVLAIVGEPSSEAKEDRPEVRRPDPAPPLAPSALLEQPPRPLIHARARPRPARRLEFGPGGWRQLHGGLLGAAPNADNRSGRRYASGR
jgi:hypothetical protein